MYAFQLVKRFQPHAGQLPNESCLQAQTKTIDETTITANSAVVGWSVLAGAKTSSVSTAS